MSEEQFATTIPNNFTRIISYDKYIPHRSPGKSNRHVWHTAYELYLIQMYLLTQNIIKSRYPKSKVQIESNVLFNDFSSLIYHFSSKHIDEYLNEPEDYLN